MADPIVIAHGRFQHGSAARRWSRVERALRRDFGNSVEIRFTSGPGDATVLAGAAVGQGARWIVAAGGDGTVHEVANGLFEGARLRDPSLALTIIPCGSANDFARSLATAAIPASAGSELENWTERSVDAGFARFQRRSGETGEEVFLNVAQCGVGAEAVKKLGRFPRSRTAYLAAALAGVLAHSPRPYRVAVNGSEVLETQPSLGVLVANGRFFGAGIPCAPTAEVDDGRLDVVLLGPFGRVEVLRKIHLLLSGRHLGERKVTLRAAGFVELASPEATPFEMDGEIRGLLPAEIRVLPRAIRIRSRR